jgi:three-Cys-motif partner protein
MVFIEADKRRFEHLVERCNAFRALHGETDAIVIDLIHGHFSKEIATLHHRLNKRGSLSNSIFYFIDPFGVKGLPYDLLRLIQTVNRSEILLTFMYEETNRFLSSVEFEEHLDSLFGEVHWRALREISGQQRKRETVDYFKGRLLNAGAKYVVAFEMRNARNATDYFLLFGTKSIRGQEVMKEAMWEVDRSGSYMFSDYTYSKGPMLIDPTPDYAALQMQIAAHFVDRRQVSVAEIREFVLTQTSFLRFMNEALRPLIARGLCYVDAEDGASARLDRDATVSFVRRAGMPLKLFDG